MRDLLPLPLFYVNGNESFASLRSSFGQLLDPILRDPPPQHEGRLCSGRVLNCSGSRLQDLGQTFKSLEPWSVLLGEEFTLVIKFFPRILYLRESDISEILGLLGVWRKIRPRLFHLCT